MKRIYMVYLFDVIEVESVNELVETEAGKFKAVKYVGEKRGGGYLRSFSFYYSKGIGLVKRVEILTKDGILQDKKELELKIL